MSQTFPDQTSTERDLLVAEHLRVEFSVRHGRRRVPLRAVNDVSLSATPNTTIAVVGESGSGKSTLARAVLRLLPLRAGRVVVDGTDITELRGAALRRARRKMQMVFQDPYSSLDPTSTISDIIGEPLRTHLGIKGADQRERVRSLLADVGLRPEHADRYVHQFSGGQRQRLAIARAIALNPRLVVLDEAVSALDMSTQNQILELLVELQEQRDVGYLFISHDLSVVRWIADRTAVMYLGRLVEEGPSGRVHDHPAHPYTRSLLSSVPVPDPEIQRSRSRILLPGETPDPLDQPSGCPFRTRCPDVMDICSEVMPDPRPVPSGGWAACHRVPLPSEQAAGQPVQPARWLDPTSPAPTSPTTTSSS